MNAFLLKALNITNTLNSDSTQSPSQLIPLGKTSKKKTADLVKMALLGGGGQKNY